MRGQIAQAVRKKGGKMTVVVGKAPRRKNEIRFPGKCD
jgi:hypothetical protein